MQCSTEQEWYDFYGPDLLTLMPMLQAEMTHKFVRSEFTSRQLHARTVHALKDALIERVNQLQAFRVFATDVSRLTFTVVGTSVQVFDPMRPTPDLHVAIFHLN